MSIIFLCILIFIKLFLSVFHREDQGTLFIVWQAWILRSLKHILGWRSPNFHFCFAMHTPSSSISTSYHVRKFYLFVVWDTTVLILFYAFLFWKEERASNFGFLASGFVEFNISFVYKTWYVFLHTYLFRLRHRFCCVKCFFFSVSLSFWSIICLIYFGFVVSFREGETFCPWHSKSKNNTIHVRPSVCSVLSL